MDNLELYHHGVKGMKWGVRKSRPSSSSSRSTWKRKRKTQARAKVQKPKAKRKKVSQMTEAELNERIKRLELEKKYKDLDPATVRSKQTNDFVIDVLKTIGKNTLTNVGTQAATHLIGEAINRAAGVSSTDNEKRLVNPQKGQSDKK